MSSVSTKKQNRILLVSLTAVLACMAILIAVTGGANKKKADKLQNDTSETITETVKGTKKGEKSESSKETETEEESKIDKNHLKEEKKESEAENTEKKDAEAIAINDTTLPQFVCPVDGIVLKEHSDNIPVYSYTMEDYRLHNGIDIAASVGTPVYAAADGTVSEINDDPMMGVCVSIAHSGGAVTCYKGLSEESLGMMTVGDDVSCGQVIGSAGNTALIESAEENHVHFELTVNGEQQNPAEYIKITKISDITEG